MCVRALNLAFFITTTEFNENYRFLFFFVHENSREKKEILCGQAVVTFLTRFFYGDSTIDTHCFYGLNMQNYTSYYLWLCIITHIKILKGNYMLKRGWKRYYVFY